MQSPSKPFLLKIVILQVDSELSFGELLGCRHHVDHIDSGFYLLKDGFLHNLKEKTRERQVVASKYSMS